MFNSKSKAGGGGGANAGPPAPPKKPKAFRWKTSGEAEADTAAAGQAGSDAAPRVVDLSEVPPSAPTPTPGSGFGIASSSADNANTISNVAALSPAKPTKVPPESETVNAGSGVGAGGGFSAADAKQTSGSLRDRIALLAGLKVDQPGAPGRPPKPWKKKTLDLPSAEPDNPSETASLETDTGSHPVKQASDEHTTAAVDHEQPASPTDNLTKALDEPEAKPAEPKSIAIPSMPARARGPQRKGRPGATAPSDSSAAVPAVPQSISVEEQLAPQPPQDAAEDNRYPPDGDHPTSSLKSDVPSLGQIGSPATEPSLDETLRGSRSGSKANIGGKGAEALEADVAGRDEYREPVTAPSERVFKQSASTAAAADDGEDWGDKRDDDDEQDDLEGEMEKRQVAVEEALARQTLEDTPTKPTMQSPPPVPFPLASSSASSTPSSPLIARKPTLTNIDVAGSAKTGESITRPIDSPVSSPRLTNRKSMSRPPVPTGFVRAPSATSSPRASMDSSLPRGSFDQSSLSRSSFDQTAAFPPSPSRSVSSLHEVMGGSTTSVDQEMRSPLSPTASFAGPASPAPSISRKPTLPPAKPQRSGSVASLRSESSAGASLVAPLSSMSKTSTRSDMPDEQGGDTTMTTDTPETNISAATQSRPSNEQADQDEEEEHEDPEVARRQKLAKRMAAMGGMKIGMLPPMFGGMKKKKATLPPEEQQQGPVSVEDPPAPAPSRAVEPVSETGAVPPSPVRRESNRPPPGAFVLPGFGKPAAPTPEEAIAKDEAQQRKQGHEQIEDEALAGHGDDPEEYAETPGADDTEFVSSPPPPALPTNRPSRPPPPPAVPSFTPSSEAVDENDELDADGDGVEEAEDDGVYEGEESALIEPEEVEYEREGDDDVEEETGPPPPLPPARPAPVLDTSGSYVTQTRSDSVDETSAPISMGNDQNSRPVSGVPLAAHGRQSSLSQPPLSPSAPTADSRRSSTLPPGASALITAPVPTSPVAGTAPQGNRMSKDYLAYLATNALRSKARDIDGPLATAINDIGNGYRLDPANFGSIVYRYLVRQDKGQSPDLQIHGRIEPGCIMLAWDAKFDRGLGRSSLRIGSAEVPHIAIVAEEVRDLKKVCAWSGDV